MNRDMLRQTVNVVAALVTIAVNVMANIVPFNGKNTGAISDSFHVFFVPAGYVFAIWGVIYLFLIAFAVYQALPSQRTNPRLRRIGWLFLAGCIANSAWIFLWHYGYLALTLVAMLTLLVSLIMIYLRLDIGRTPVPTVEKWCVDMLFKVYLGWITVATVANVTDLLYDLKWNGFGIQPEVWAAIMLLVTMIVTIAMILTRLDVAYTLVIIWAGIGVANKQVGSPLVANTAWLVVVVVATVLVVVWLLKHAGRFTLLGAAS
jgi:translocator protein